MKDWHRLPMLYTPDTEGRRYFSWRIASDQHPLSAVFWNAGSARDDYAGRGGRTEPWQYL